MTMKKKQDAPKVKKKVISEWEVVSVDAKRSMILGRNLETGEEEEFPFRAVDWEPIYLSGSQP